MKVKKEIEKLLRSSSGTVRLNSIACLRRRVRDGLDCMEIVFDSINGVDFNSNASPIKSRYVEGIVIEANRAVADFLEHVRNQLAEDLKADNRTLGDGSTLIEKAAKYDAIVAKNALRSQKIASSMTPEQRMERAKKAAAARYGKTVK